MSNTTCNSFAEMRWWVCTPGSQHLLYHWDIIISIETIDLKKFWRKSEWCKQYVWIEIARWPNCRENNKFCQTQIKNFNFWVHVCTNYLINLTFSGTKFLSCLLYYFLQSSFVVFVERKNSRECISPFHLFYYPLLNRKCEITVSRIPAPSTALGRKLSHYTPPPRRRSP